MEELTHMFAIEAREMLEAGFIDEAIDLCRRGIEKYPEYQAAYAILAEALIQKGEAAQAADVITSASEIFPAGRIIRSVKDSIFSRANDIIAHSKPVSESNEQPASNETEATYLTIESIPFIVVKEVVEASEEPSVNIETESITEDIQDIEPDLPEEVQEIDAIPEVSEIKVEDETEAEQAGIPDSQPEPDTVEVIRDLVIDEPLDVTAVSIETEIIYPEGEHVSIPDEAFGEPPVIDMDIPLTETISGEISDTVISLYEPDTETHIDIEDETRIDIEYPIDLINAEISETGADALVEDIHLPGEADIPEEMLDEIEIGVYTPTDIITDEVTINLPDVGAFEIQPEIEPVDMEIEEYLESAPETVSDDRQYYEESPDESGLFEYIDRNFQKAAVVPLASKVNPEDFKREESEIINEAQFLEFNPEIEVGSMDERQMLLEMIESYYITSGAGTEYVQGDDEETESEQAEVTIEVDEEAKVDFSFEETSDSFEESETGNDDETETTQIPRTGGKLVFRSIQFTERDSNAGNELKASNLGLIPGLDFSPLKVRAKKLVNMNHLKPLPEIPPFPEFALKRADKHDAQPQQGEFKPRPLSIKELAEQIKNLGDSSEMQPDLDNADGESHITVTETMANIYLMQGAYAEAADAYKALAEKNPDKKEYYMKKAKEAENRL